MAARAVVGQSGCAVFCVHTNPTNHRPTTIFTWDVYILRCVAGCALFRVHTNQRPGLPKSLHLQRPLPCSNKLDQSQSLHLGCALFLLSSVRTQTRPTTIFASEALSSVLTRPTTVLNLLRCIPCSHKPGPYQAPSHSLHLQHTPACLHKPDPPQYLHLLRSLPLLFRVHTN